MKILFMTDSHIKGRTPINRLGDFYQDMKKKVQEVVGYAKQLNCDEIWHGGDLFDAPVVSLSICDEIIDILESLKIPVRVVRGNHDCFSLDTRLLTLDGYKRYDEVKIGDLVPTVNLELKCVEYRPIEKIIVREVDESYIVHSRTLQGNFSKSHRHYVIPDKAGTDKSRDFHLKYDWRVKTSEELFKYKNLRLPYTFQSGNKDYDISNDWLELFGFIHTDGWFDSKYQYVLISQSKIKNVDRIRELCNKLKLKCSESVRRRKTKSICGKLVKSVKPVYQFRFNSESSRRIKRVLKLSSDKMSLILPDLSDKQMEKVSHYLCKGDGSYNKYGTIQLWGKKDILEKWMGLFVTHNVGCSLVKDKRDSFYLCIHCREIHGMGNRNVKQKHLSVIKGKSLMWDVTVKNHVIFVERNGRPFITGNCIGHNPHLSGQSILDHIFRRSSIIQHFETYETCRKDLFFQGFDYYHNIENDLKANGLFANNPTRSDAKKIAVIHAFILDKPAIFNHVLIDELKTDFNVILTGHYHSEFGVIRRNDTTYIGIGGLARLSIGKGDRDRIPKCLYFDMKKPEIKIIPLKSVRPERETFNLEAIEEIKQRTDNIDQFVESLGSVSSQTLELMDMVQEALSRLDKKDCQLSVSEIKSEIAKRIGDIEKCQKI